MNAFTVQDAPLNMAPTGIATFAKVPICYDIHHANADIAILGAPFDLAIQGKTGCRLGPAWDPQCIYPLPHEKGRQL